MLRKFASVSGFTLLSRLTGFFRDLVIASMLGSGLAADAYFVAQRLPNHFRAIFGEGAFNSAFVPSYSSEIKTNGEAAALHFAGRILTLLTAVLVPLCVLALWYMPFVIDLLAPGFKDEPEKYALAITLTRITFPYLLMISLVTLLSGVLNAHNRFAAAAGAPVLLNLAIMAALGVAFLFPSAAHAAAWGIAVSGALQLALLGYDAWRNGLLPRFEKPVISPAMQRFFKALGPAVIGSAGVQIAIFADTIIASLLPTGAVSAISYADRLYQLPIGLIGIAAGTVLLPEMSRHLAADAPDKAHAAQNRSIGLSLALSMPFLVAFAMIPNEILRGVFVRGQFTVVDANAAASVLKAYAIGLLPIVLIRSFVSGFYARHDTTTPLLAAFIGIGVNVAAKVMLYRTYGASGLAFATALGAWINASLLAALALRTGIMAPDKPLYRKTAAVSLAGAVLAGTTPFLIEPSERMASGLGGWSSALSLLGLATLGALLYGAVLLASLKALRTRL
jgi:putative peptidoglycan lipid II flippase